MPRWNTLVLVRFASQCFLERTERLASSLLPCRCLRAAISVAEGVENQFNPGRHSKLFEDPIEVIPYRMLLNLKPLGDFAVLQPVGDEVNHFFLAAR